MRRLLRRLLRPFRRVDLERDIADELRHHLERETEALEARGLAPAEARRMARARFGAVDGVADDVRRQYGLPWLDDALRDASLAVRAFARRPGLPLAVALTLALGIGAGSAVFAALRAVLMDVPAYADPQSLLFVWRTEPTGERLRVSGPDAAVIAEAVPGIAALGFVARISEASLAREGAPAAPLRLGSVTWNLFDVLGVSPALGRGFTAADGSPGGGDVLLLDETFFRTRLGADSSVLGRTLELDGRRGTVVGVLPAGFRLLLPAHADLPQQVDAWQPLPAELAALSRPDREADQDSDNTGIVLARMRAAATRAQVQSGLNAVASELRAAVPSWSEAEWGLQATRLDAELTAAARPVLRIVAGAVLLILLLAGANAAGLLLTRAVDRSRELAVRAALGARAGRLARQIILENALLAGAGATAGVALAWLLVRSTSPRLESLVPGAVVRVDGIVMLAAAVLALLLTAAVSCAVLLDPSLRGAAAGRLVTRGAVSFSRGARRLRASLVALQVAASLALVVGAAVMIRTAQSLASQDPGFRTSDVLSFRVGLAFPDRYRGPADRSAIVRELESRILAVPGVEAVGLVGGLPLADPEFTQPWSAADAAPATWGRERANYRVVTGGWFDAMGTRVLEGRAFRAQDDRQDRRVIIIDATLAQRLSAGGSALGSAVRVPMDGQTVTATVVGVVENVRFESLAEPGRETIYVPYRHEASRRVAFVVRTSLDPLSLSRPIADAIAAVDAGIAMHDVRPLSAIVAEAVRPARDVMRVLTAFAAAALLLALVALHAAVAYGVQRRTAEIGLRLALGATPRQVVAHAMQAGLVPCAAGLALGMLLVVAAAPVLRALVHGVSPLDPRLLTAAAASLLGACTIAARLAAGRAAAIAPGTALGGAE